MFSWKLSKTTYKSLANYSHCSLQLRENWTMWPLFKAALGALEHSFNYYRWREEYMWEGHNMQSSNTILWTMDKTLRKYLDIWSWKGMLLLFFWPHSMWDLGSPMRDQSHDPCVGSSEWPTREHARKTFFCICREKDIHMDKVNELIRCFQGSSCLLSSRCNPAWWESLEPGLRGLQATFLRGCRQGALPQKRREP